MDTITRTPAMIIDMHRSEGTWNIGTGTAVECACGHRSTALTTEFLDAPLTSEMNPRRVAERRHAEHVADMLA